MSPSSTQTEKTLARAARIRKEVGGSKKKECNGNGKLGERWRTCANLPLTLSLEGISVMAPTSELIFLTLYLNFFIFLEKRV